MSGERLRVTRTGAPPRITRVADTGVREFLAFMLGSESYALPLSCIREILRVPPITEVPRAAPDVLGIISVRGQVTTLFDLRRKLSLPCAPVTQKTRVLLADQGEEPLGLLCDRVLEVQRLTEQEVELASVLGHETSSYVMGIGRPGARKGQTAAARGATRRAAARGTAAASLTKTPEVTRDPAHDILILLDPIALLKRHGHG